MEKHYSVLHCYEKKIYVTGLSYGEAISWICRQKETYYWKIVEERN